MPVINDTMVSTAEAGVPADGVSDAQPMLQAILDAGHSIALSPGDYLLRRSLRSRANYQKIIGPGWGAPAGGNRPAARFLVLPPANGVRGFLDGGAPILRVNHPFFTVRELEFAFSHPVPAGPATRADMVRYGPAIRIRSTGLRVEDVMISGAWDGIHGATNDTLETNPGRAHLERVYVGAMNTGVRLDSALGTVQVSNCQAWPFGWTSDPWLDLWQDSTAFQFGAIDNLQISDVIAFRSAVRFLAEPYPKNPTVLRGPIGSFSGITLDGSRARIEMTGGRINGSNVYKTTAVDDPRPTVDVSGSAELCLSNLNILNTTEPGPFVLARDKARVALTGGIISATANPGPYVALAAHDRAELSAIGINFRCTDRDPDCTFVEQRGSALVSAVGNRARGLRSNAASARFADLAAPDLPHAFAGNAFPGFV